MREIRFRGKISGGDWVYGYLYQDETGTYIKESEQNKRFGTGFEVIPETVGQLTGVKDKHGKDVFEGDIVRAWDRGACVKCEVKWSTRLGSLIKCGHCQRPQSPIKMDFLTTALKSLATFTRTLI